MSDGADTIEKGSPAPKNEVYQYSILSALVCSVYSTSVGRPMSAIQSHGNFGLGTFVNLDGEMIMVDNIPYRLAYDGFVSVIDPNTLMTFATITQWPEKPKFRVKVEDVDTKFTKSVIQEWIENKVAMDTRNDFLAIKITGGFKYIQMRTAKAVTAEQSFRDVPSTQRVEEVKEPGIVGTMIGFRAPEWVQGVTVAGYHLHFISEKRDKGGHVLNYEVDQSAILEVEVMKGFKIDLPNSKDFEKADIKLNLEDILNVEGK